MIAWIQSLIKNFSTPSQVQVPESFFVPELSEFNKILKPFGIKIN